MSALKLIAISLARWSAVMSGTATAFLLVASIASSADQVRPRPCPHPVQESEMSSGADVQTFVFHIAGTRPTDYLSSLYERLSQCAPRTLKPIAVQTERGEIYTYARKAETLPNLPRDVVGKPRAFETAVFNLTNQYGHKIPSGRGTFYVPSVKATWFHDNLQQWLDAGSNQKSLDTLCKNLGYEERCVSKADIQSKPQGNAPAKKYVNIRHYRIDVEITLPTKNGNALANDLLSYIADKNQGLKNDPENLPTFTIRPGSAQSQSDGSDSECLEAVAENVQKAVNWTPTNSPNPPRVLVVEHAVGPSRIGSLFPLAELKHPYFTGKEIVNVKVLASPLPGREDDIGHMFHVAHIIGARGRAKGWSGFAANADVFITDIPYFLTTFLIARKNELQNSPSGGTESYYRAVNLSFMFDKEGVCDALTPGSDHTNSLNTFRRIKAILDREATAGRSPQGSLLYVFAASSTSTTCNYTDDDGDRPRNYPLDNCTDLACLGRSLIGITVVPLNSDLSSGRPEARLDTKNLLLSAPGTGILSADVDLKSNQLGFRARCGSSQATPIVAAVAAELRSRYNLSAASTKERLYATARMLQTPASTRCSDTRIGGVLDIKKAIESDPSKDVIWLRPTVGSGELRRLEGKITFFPTKQGGQGYSNVPPLRDGGPLPCNGGGTPIDWILAIKRVAPVPGEVSTPTFRNLFRIGDDVTQLSIKLGASYALDRDSSGKSICAVSPSQQLGLSPCIVITLSNGQRTPVDASTIDLIVLHDR